jgi:hypothetical protein
MGQVRVLVLDLGGKLFSSTGLIRRVVVNGHVNSCHHWAGSLQSISPEALPFASFEDDHQCFGENGIVGTERPGRSNRVGSNNQ